MLEAEQIMKRCQIGTRNYNEANNLHAECYRIIGKLLAERTDKKRILQLIKELRPAIKPLDGMGKGKTTHEWFDILVKDIEEKI
jgi:hypothetical protein